MTYSSEKLVEVQRAGIIESLHRGFIAVVNDQGEVICSLGNPNQLIFARSAAKPLQALAVLDHPEIEAFNLHLREVALMCASHNGEKYHVESVQSMLAKFGAGPDNLSCGIHPPFHKATAEAMTKQQASFTTLHNNCSGKHAGMVALARVLGVSIVDYANHQHPVQVEMKQVIAEMTELDATEIQLGTDGCGVPVFGLPLAKLAYAYAKLGTGHSCSQVRKMSCELILQAMVNYPEYVAGEDRYDTRLILATNGRIIGKMGAEAVFALTIPSEKIGIAIKIEDGNFRALYPTVTETLHQLGYITDNEYNDLQTWHNPVIYNHAGAEVGLLVPSFNL